jgi:hypothetical protein
MWMAELLHVATVLAIIALACLGAALAVDAFAQWVREQQRWRR